MSEEEVKAALRRRALGFETDEVVEEYGFNEGEAVLLKRKISKKVVPPDIQAAKMLMEEQGTLRTLTDEQLAAEKERLLRLLTEEEKH